MVSLILKKYNYNVMKSRSVQAVSYHLMYDLLISTFKMKGNWKIKNRYEYNIHKWIKNYSLFEENVSNGYNET